MDVLRWRKAYVGLSWGLAATSSAWAAPPDVLVQNHGLLGASFGMLTLAMVVLGALEIKDSRGRNLDLEIDRLAAAAAQRQARVNSDASALISEDTPAPSPASMQTARMTAPPPPPPAGAVMPPPPPPPSRNVPPPPPPPPPSADPSDSFGARLGAAALDDAIKPPVPKAPLTFGGSTPPAPPPADGGSPGGWADLLQRVRSNESEAPNPFKAGSAPAIPATEDEPSSPSRPPSGGGDAWEALLRKTAGASGEFPPPPPRSGVGLPGGSPFAANTGGSGSDPEPGRASGETDDALPDFVKRASRTISLDLNKGGTGSNPFQKPPQ